MQRSSFHGYHPCWALVGNKSDLAQHERMVDIGAGRRLAAELGCHIFRECSVKESMSDARSLFADLFRQFVKVQQGATSSSSPLAASVRLPLRGRKLNGRIYDRVPLLRSSSYLKSGLLPVIRTREQPQEIDVVSQPGSDDGSDSVASAPPNGGVGCNNRRRRNAFSLVCDVTSKNGSLFATANNNNNSSSSNSSGGGIHRSSVTSALSHRTDPIVPAQFCRTKSVGDMTSLLLKRR